MRATEQELGQIHKDLFLSLRTILLYGIPAIDKKTNTVILKAPTASIVSVARKFMTDNTSSYGRKKTSPKLSDFYQIPSTNLLP